ncbi:hypothetical protein ACHAPT_008655 [Fusarium lateritium]
MELEKPPSGSTDDDVCIPKDGIPVTIVTHRHKPTKSQTSLLIEYLEGAMPASGSIGRRPSVRVRLTPAKKGRNGRHPQVTESKGSVTRRIPLDLPDHYEGGDSGSSYAPASDKPNVPRNPIDIEIDRGRRLWRPESPLIPSEYDIQPSEPREP